MKKVVLFFMLISIVCGGLFQGNEYQAYATEDLSETLDYIRISDNVYMAALYQSMLLNPAEITDDGIYTSKMYTYETQGTATTPSIQYIIVYRLKTIDTNSNFPIETPNHTIPIENAVIVEGIYVKEGMFGAEEDITDYYMEDYPDEIIEDIAAGWEEENEEKGYECELLEPASIRYNCHSYAWYKQNPILNNLWMSSPVDYYSYFDNSYERVKTECGEQPRIGDIIVYADYNRRPNHSGVIIGYTNETETGSLGNANKYMVNSKWGDAGLYRHRGDHCSYYESAAYVEYYRLRTDEVLSISSGVDMVEVRKTVISLDSAENSLETETVLSKADTNIVCEVNVTQSGISDIIITSSYALNISLLDLERHNVTLQKVSESDDTYFYLLYGNLSVGIYYIRAEFSDSSHSGEIVIKVRPHQHYYYKFTDSNDYKHTSECVCGYTTLHDHVIKSNSVIGRFKPCAYCGHIIDTEGSINVPIIRNEFADDESQY